MISCILLAAGLSTRFGSSKALAKLNDKNVLEHLQQVLLATSINEIIVVLGAYADQIKPFLLNHRKVKFVYNKDFNLGQTSSFQAGLQNISSQTQGIMLLPVDYPAIKKQTLDQLIDVFLKQNPMILIPTFNHRKGHPPIFSSKLKDDFLRLDHSVGVNTVAQIHQKETLFFSVADQGVVQTFNNAEEFEQLKKTI